MDAAEPNNAPLWHHIASTFYWGLLAYVALLLIAFVNDLWRKVRPLARLMRHRQSRFSLSRVHHAFTSRYRDTNVFYYVEAFRLLANAAVCVVYVYGSYLRNVNTVVRVVQRIFFAFFVVDLLAMISTAESAISSALDWAAFFDAVSLPSLYIAVGPNSYLNLSFLRAVPAYKAYSRLERRTFVKVFSSKRLVGKLAFQCVALFYTLACGIQLLEVPGDLLSPDFRDSWSEFGDWNFFNSVYFVIVTLSTVGYGDFSPATVQGRIYTILMIVVGIVIFTNVIGELVEHSRRGRGAGWFVKNADTRHVIVSGTPTLADLVQFVSEFYSDSRDTNADARVVILVENPAWSDLEWFQYIARNQFLQARLQFLVGSVRNLVDLQRVRLNSADAMFFLTSPSTGEDAAYQDARTVMNILAVRNVRTDIPIYTQTLLDGSSLQTNVALTTPTCYPKDTFMREENMSKNASYRGLFNQVLKTEFRNLPWAHRRDSRRCLADVEKFHAERQSMVDAEKPSGGLLSDLERSRLVCLQATQASLLAANVKANGVGTLLSNMYLDVQVSKATADDPGWLAEYHMGAACSLGYAIVPESLDGVAILQIVDELYHVGLVLIATSDANSVEQIPVLDTNMPLRRGDIALFMSYLEHRHIGAALYLVAMRFERDELRHSMAPTSSVDKNRKASSTSTSQRTSCAPTPSAGNDEDDDEDTNMLDRKLMPQEPDPPVSYPSGRRVGDPKGVLGTELLSSGHPDFDSQDECGVPRNLSGHLIIAVEDEAPLANLPMFLKSLWRKDDRRAMRRARKTIVLVITPTINESFRQKFREHEGKCLFFIEGCPASSEIWMEAKLNQAKSVVTMADYTKPWYESDARTIFTLLTLEVHTAPDHDVFICSELVDEKSLEFLRSPAHPRRRGAALGEVAATLQSPSRSADSVSIKSMERNSGVRRIDHPGGLDRSPLPTDTSATQSDHVTLENIDEDTANNSRRLSGDHGGEGHDPPKASGMQLKSVKQALETASHRKKGDGGEAKAAKNVVLKTLSPLEPSRMAEARTDPTAKLGAARARRGSLFSRSRYASGELLVHSGTITVLAREYVEPGFANLFANILGVDTSSSPGLKIRLVRIPKTMFLDQRLVKLNDGTPLVPYRSIFKALIRHGVTPLGLYRSGAAMTLVPRRSRRRRGRAILEELEPYFLEMQQQEEWKGRKRRDSSSSRGLLGSFINSITGVIPSQMREAQGRIAINGNEPESSSSDEDSSDMSESSESPPEAYESEHADKKAGKPRMQRRKSHRERAISSLKKPGNSARGPDFLARWARDEKSADVPGQSKCTGRQPGNLLPYVYTLPEPNTLCAETDGIYILCHPTHELSPKWSETLNEGNASSSDSSGPTRP